MLLQNLVLQFALPHRQPSDLEAQTDEKLDEATSDDMMIHGDQYISEADPNDDKDITENEFFQQLEREDQDARTKRHRFPTFGTWSSLSSGRHTPTRISLLWSRLKRNLDSQTSPVDLESYAPNYRYLPIISGIVIPLSILLEIPGLTEDWYIRTVANKTVERKPNPAVLDTGLAFSMLFGVLANICLICRFMEKMVKPMTMLCVMFLTVHDIINIIAVIIFGIEHRFSDGFTYGQGFWMVVCSTAVSTFTNITLIFDLVWTPQFSTSGSGLTRKQRLLVISVMFLLCYIAFGALVQTFLLEVRFLDALYFTVVTIETIGFGDIHPRTIEARVFTGLYTIFGIVSLALAVGLARETILEGIEVGYRKRVKMIQKRRKLLYRDRRIIQRWRAAVEFRLNQMGQPIWADNPIHKHSFLGHIVDKILPQRQGKRFSLRYDSTLNNDTSHPHDKHLNLEALSWAQLESAALEAGAPLHTLLPPGFQTKVAFSGSGESIPPTRQPDCPEIPLTHARLGRMISMLSSFGIAVNDSQLSKVPQPIRSKSMHMAVTQQPERPASIRCDSLRSTIEKEERRAFFVRFSVVWLMFLVFWTVGSGIFTVTENWTYGTALYFCFVSFTTIGYGDFTPQTPAGRCIFVVWALLGVATMTILISILSEAYSSRYKRAFTSHIFNRAIQQHRERTRDALRHKKAPADKPITTIDPVPSKTFDESLDDFRRRTEGHIARLPHELRCQAQAFNESMQYLMSRPNVVGVLETDMPEGLKQLINDVAGVERLGNSIQKEVISDPTTRTALLALSMEQAVRKMVCMTEEAIESIKERDRLIELRSTRLDGVP